jgi:hypothetical protein
MKILFMFIVILLAGCSSQITNESPELITTEILIRQLDIDFDECEHEAYETSESSPLEEQSFCIAYIDESEIVVVIQKFTNFHDLDGSYQYSSLHLRGFQGLINEDTYGDFSRFYFTEDIVIYYNLWIIKDEFLIHITSKNLNEQEVIEQIAENLLEKFD